MNKLTNLRWWVMVIVALFLLPAAIVLFILSCTLFILRCTLVIFDRVVDKLVNLLYATVNKLKRFTKRGE